MEDPKFENEEVNEFYKEKAVNLSEKTRQTKMDVIINFLDIIGGLSVKNIAKEDVITYIKSDYFSKLSTSDKNLNVAHLRSFFKHFDRNDLI